ncbi:MAG: type VI secretion system-associated FHA domain protein TagH [Gammaproteobacteria bacterium]|nr:type VI secretion system-associated FHA domain protein TagH [Gammaproteobacteria bacterium]MBU2676342.1 type VI secretion system-associated FHA domain protein TagH [Gammaproteobacteria bacterium]NNC57916.1 type VI secretion system-associated FHA domain protein TagH [Woeseiaceae bacterium]NNL50076.1 type VI secretion system-associated FHA domain protein TagH [Woeseiaceae bacterium]
MTLQLKIVSKHRELVGEDAQREFHEEGGTIGRSLQNDWILPDPDRYISGRHATIDHKGGSYYLLDTSSNGVYINDEVEPIGKGHPRRLFDGDRMRMGDFEFVVAVDSGESLELPPEPKPSVVPDNIEQLVEEVSLRTGVKLIEEEEITGDDEFQSVLFSHAPEEAPPPPPSEQEPAAREPKPEPKAAARPDPKPKAARKPEPKPKTARKSEPKPKTAGTKRDASSETPEDLFVAFLDGLGVNRAELHPSIDRPHMMKTAGVVLREFVEGVINLLAARANLKNAFRLDQTTLLPRHNNPLKFSESPDDLLKQLLVGDEGDYLGAKDAVHEACHDLLNHQNAFLDAMNSAFIEFSDRFEPDELQQGFDRAIGESKLFAFKNKSKYWDLYRDLYPIMTEKGGGRFPQMFGEEFVRAYERQVAEYQRHDREQLAETGGGSAESAQDLKVTQKMGARKIPRQQPREPDEVDQDFIDELDNSMAEEIDPWASARHRRPT